MANLAKELERSKAQRDAAKALITSDIGFIKRDVSARGVKDRAVSWSKTRPPQLGEQAVQFVRDNPGKIAIGAGAAIAAIGVVAFRKPLADLATGLFEVLAEMEEREDDAESLPDNPEVTSTMPQDSDVLELAPEQAFDEISEDHDTVDYVD